MNIILCSPTTEFLGDAFYGSEFMNEVQHLISNVGGDIMEIRRGRSIEIELDNDDLNEVIHRYVISLCRDASEMLKSGRGSIHIIFNGDEETKCSAKVKVVQIEDVDVYCEKRTEEEDG